MPSHIPLLTGPTAVGKTTLAVEFARRFDGEIVSADARQVYRDLEIGTAKPSESERAAVVHHFVNELNLSQSFSAGRFARAAEHRIREIASRGKMPVVVGGSTLYIEALVNGLAEIPDIDPDVRNSLKTRLEAEGIARLYQELREVDPEAAATMDVTKSQRILRALEVYHGTGRALSHFHRNHVRPSFLYRGVVLERPRSELYERIDKRVSAMLEAGLVDEVRGLLDAGVDPGIGPLRTIGYREVVGYLQGAYDRVEMARLLMRNTRRYAKRQLTWLKRYPDFARLSATAPINVLARHLLG